MEKGNVLNFIVKKYSIFSCIEITKNNTLSEKIDQDLYVRRFNRSDYFNNLSISSDLILCFDTLEYLSEDECVNFLKNIGQRDFKYIMLKSDNIKFNRFIRRVNLKIYPFNFYKFTEELADSKTDKRLLFFDRETFLSNLTNLGKLFIKNYDGLSMTAYIMQELHEELYGYLGNFDTKFPSFENLNQYFLKKYKTLPKSILLLWNYSDELYNKIRKDLPYTKIILWVDDTHWFSSEQREENRKNYSRSDYMISKYDYFQLFYNIQMGEKLWKTYHSCNSHFYSREINPNPINKIYMYGAITPIHYPLRCWFMDAIKDFDPEKFYYKPHPSYDGNQFEQSLLTGKELYEYEFCYTAGAFPKFEIDEPENATYYLVGKFFEICGSGSLLLCHDYGVKDELNSLGFFDMVHYVNINQTNFFEKINWLYDPDNSDKIKEIRENGHNLVLEKHLTYHRCYDINDKILSTLT